MYMFREGKGQGIGKILQISIKFITSVWQYKSAHFTHMRYLIFDFDLKTQTHVLFGVLISAHTVHNRPIGQLIDGVERLIQIKITLVQP